MLAQVRARLLGGFIIASLVTPAIATPSLAQEQGALSATLFSGNCFVYDEESAVSVAELNKTSNEKVLGMPSVGEGIVARPIEELQNGEFALVIERAGSPGFVIACGETVGAPLPDGSLAVGLREFNASFYSGVAVLTPNGAETIFRLFVGNGLGRGTVTEAGEADTPVDDTVVVSVSDDGITADQNTFTVGSRVEFIVTNDGDRPHEVMLEREGANEEPLDIRGDQAETEDIAPGDVAVFTFTFTEAGTYQLADHIGGNSFVFIIEVN